MVYRGSRHFGDLVEFAVATDWPLIGAKGAEECQGILEELRARGLLSQFLDRWTLTWKGWEIVEPVVGGVPGFGFVAMAFHDELKAAYDDGIQPAIEHDCKLTALRVDREHFKEKICDRIIVDIRRAEFVVADFTFHRGGVYFEAGYALALGRTVVWSCREDHFGDLHFDTRQYPHIVWREPADLRVQLRDRRRYLIPGARRS